MKNNWKEEFVKWFYEEPAMELANGVGTPENIADWWIGKLAEQKRELLLEVRTYIGDLDYEDMQTKGINQWIDEFITSKGIEL